MHFIPIDRVQSGDAFWILKMFFIVDKKERENLYANDLMFDANNLFHHKNTFKSFPIHFPHLPEPFNSIQISTLINCIVFVEEKNFQWQFLLLTQWARAGLREYKRKLLLHIFFLIRFTMIAYKNNCIHTFMCAQFCISAVICNINRHTDDTTLMRTYMGV
jgi:hypothetical protein